jgi:excisionase family DNA binding protein
MQMVSRVDRECDGQDADRSRRPLVTALTLDIAEELVERIAKRAAEFLACPRSRIYALVSARRLPHHHDGSRLLFDRRELREDAVLKIKGRKDQIRQADVRQVVQWASDAKLPAGIEHKPLLIGNPHCETAPSERGEPLGPNGKAYAENGGVGGVRTPPLF